MSHSIINEVIVSFEYTDAHISINDDGSYIQNIIDRLVKLCEVFDYEFEPVYQRIDDLPHCAFRVRFNYNILSYQHNINVLTAFAQEFQVLITSASLVALDESLD